ncbi:uncharacterized protein [Aegilops tauschii subsp. strangulata]|uniref:uncharacterized protein isoform X2 n=1 Tax=Aegilops tauschii subsp. strangulata TaxID=200361 RepID=UPI001ABD3963|nr:uncharacterized protein LOC109787571 isoform X2 [Aegilops tauschii subsp. strangulata]
MYGSCNLHIHNSEAIELQSAHNPHRVVHLSVPFRGTHLVDSGEEENFSGTSDFVAGRKALLEISELRCGFEQFCQEELASMFHLLGLELWFMEKSCMISQDLKSFHLRRKHEDIVYCGCSSLPQYMAHTLSKNGV